MNKKRLVTETKEIRRMIEAGEVTVDSFMRIIEHSGRILMYTDGLKRRGEQCYIQNGEIQTVCGTENRIGPEINLQGVGYGIDSDIMFEDICEENGYDLVVAYDIHWY